MVVFPDDHLVMADECRMRLGVCFRSPGSKAKHMVSMFLLPALQCWGEPYRVLHLNADEGQTRTSSMARQSSEAEQPRVEHKRKTRETGCRK